MHTYAHCAPTALQTDQRGIVQRKAGIIPFLILRKVHTILAEIVGSVSEARPRPLFLEIMFVLFLDFLKLMEISFHFILGILIWH